MVEFIKLSAKQASKQECVVLAWRMAKTEIATFIEMKCLLCHCFCFFISDSDDDDDDDEDEDDDT